MCLNTKDIKGIHVTSYQANYASHHTLNCHVGFLSPQGGSSRQPAQASGQIKRLYVTWNSLHEPLTHFIKDFKFHSSVCQYFCHSVIVRYYDITQMVIFCVSHTKLLGVETYMAVMSTMTCKIGFI